jgi:hypothetical protein
MTMKEFLGGERKKMEKINSKKVGKVIGAALAVFLLAMVMQPVMAGVDAEITGVSLNGQGDFIEVEPGELIGVKVFFEWKLPWSPQETLDEIAVGFEDTPIFCVVDTIINNVAEYDSGNIDNAIEAFGIIAPTEPGTYCIMETRAKGYTCEDAKELYRKNCDSRRMIADFDVIEHETKEWKCIYEEFVELTPLFGIERNYNIAFYQRGNELRMEIDTPNTEDIYDGSLSISIEEDVNINYSTGNVLEKHLVVADFMELDINPSNKVGSALLSLLAGFVPPIGMCGNTIGLGEAIYEETSDFSVHDEVDHERILDCYPAEIFTEKSHLNDRDVVVIPWKVWFDGIHAIRVNCPQMEFPDESTHNVVFCIDCKIHGGKMRHYIALPIEFTSTWTTDDDTEEKIEKIEC